MKHLRVAHEGLSSDEWVHTARLLGTIAVLDLWLWTEEKALAETSEQYLKSTEKTIAESSQYIASKNAQYFQNGFSIAIEFQTAFRTTREWSEILKAGTHVVFPQLDFLQVASVGGVFHLHEHLESLLVVAYLRHVVSNRKSSSQDQATESEQNTLSTTESSAGDQIYDEVITGRNPDALSRAITAAAKGLKTLVIDWASKEDEMTETFWRVRELEDLPHDFNKIAM